MGQQASGRVAFGRALTLGTLAVVLTVGLLLLIPNLPHTPASEMGGLIVLSIVVVLVLLFLLTSGFAALGLSDKGEALGLPPGSIRALIAILLLMVFVFFSVYLYSQVIAPPLFCRESLTAIQRDTVSPPPVITYRNGYDQFEACVRYPTSEASERFAQQIFTAVMTLATAVASFYFGSRSVESAIGAAAAISSTLSLVGIAPRSGRVGEVVVITNLAGTGFADGAAVRLTRAGTPDITASELEVISSTRIICKLDLTNASVGKWDLLVKNPDGKQATKSNEFEVLAGSVATPVTAQPA